MFNQSVIPFQWYHWFSYIFQGSLTVMCKRNSRNRKSAIFISGRSTNSPRPCRSCYNVLYRGYGIPFVQALYRALCSVGQRGMPTPECMCVRYSLHYLTQRAETGTGRSGIVFSRNEFLFCFLNCTFCRVISLYAFLTLFIL